MAGVDFSQGLKGPISDMVRVVLGIFYIVGKVRLDDGRCSGPIGNDRSRAWIFRGGGGIRRLDGIGNRVHR